MKRSVSWLLALVMALTLCICGTAAAGGADLAGTYLLDAAPLGMPLTVYLMVDADGHFQWTNKLEGGADKGNGQIGEQDGLYIMLYADSTTEALKTATFTMDGVNLVFSTRIPYGSSGLAPNTEDEANIIYPEAKKMLYTEYQGDYVGALDVEAMGSSITYQVTLSLGNGAAYTLESVFDMGGETYTYVQEGVYAIEDGQLTLTAEGKDAQTGTVAEDGITVNAYLSQMAASPREVTLKKATTAAVAGVYTGVDATLTLDAVGGYTYAAEMAQEGAFTVDGGTVTLLAPDGTQAVYTLENHVLTSDAGQTLYRDVVQGVFTAAGTDDAGYEVASTLTLNPDGTYAIEVVTDGFVTWEEAGTFTTTASLMGVSLVLTADDGTVSTGVVSGTININHNVDAAYNTLGFKYDK